MKSPNKIVGKFFAIFILSIITVSSFSFLPITVNAQVNPPIEYTPLSPLPHTTTVEGCTGTACKSTLETYVPGIFKIIIGLAAVIAVGRIIWGGILYITTDAWSTKSEGREMIKKAVLGLVFITASWVIFYTINPSLFANNALTIKIGISSDTITGGLPTLSIGANGATVQCTDCTVITGVNISNGSNKQISASILPNLQTLNSNSSLVPWQITEANPPTYTHVDPCHTNGTCIDANFITTPSGIPALSTAINNFLNASASDGLSASYEVTTQAAKDALLSSPNISAANKAKIVLNTAASGAHFHVEKP